MADTVLTRYGRDTSAVFDRLDEHCAGQAEQSFGGQDPRLANPTEALEKLLSRQSEPGFRNPTTTSPGRSVPPGSSPTITDEPSKHTSLEVPNAS